MGLPWRQLHSFKWANPPEGAERRIFSTVSTVLLVTGESRRSHLSQTCSHRQRTLAAFILPDFFFFWRMFLPLRPERLSRVSAAVSVARSGLAPLPMAEIIMLMLTAPLAFPGSRCQSFSCEPRLCEMSASVARVNVC